MEKLYILCVVTFIIKMHTFIAPQNICLGVCEHM